MDTERESALKVDSGRYPLLYWGIKPESVECRFILLPTELHPHPEQTNKKTDQKASQLQLYCLNGISPMGSLGLPSLGKASCDIVMLPNLGCMLGVLVFP